MKKLAMLGLVLALTTLGLAAGASSAMALEFCKAAEKECSEENVFKEGAAISATATEPKFESSLGTVICKSSGLEAETASEAGKPLPMFINSISYSGCTVGKTECSVTTLNLSYYALLSETGEEKANLSVSNGGPGTPSTTLKCGTTISCTVGAASMTLAFQGGKPATITATKVALKKESGTVCPTEASWSATYKTTTPEQLRIGVRNTVLCTAAPQGGLCPANSGFNGSIEGDLIAAEAKLAKAATPFTPAVSCSEEISGGMFAEAGTGTLSTWKLETGLGPCNSNFAEDPTVAVKVEGLSFASSSIVYRNASRAILLTAGANVPKIKFTIEHPTPTTCKYVMRRPSWEIFAYNPMKMKSLWRGTLETGGAAECATQIAITDEQKVIKLGGGNIWVLNG